MITSEKIKITHVSYAVSKQTASYRLHRELIKTIDSRIFVSSKSIISSSIIQPNSFLEKFISKFGLLRELIISKIFPNNKKAYFSYNIGPVLVQLFWINKLFKQKSDIFHLHWIGNGFINYNQIHKFKKPIVITLHDVWFVTGGCHVNFECKKYEIGCNKCPLFKNKLYPIDLTNYIFNKKKKIFDNKNIEIVVLSTWMKEIVSNSPIFSKCNINLIPNGLDTNIFKPFEKKLSREFFSINSTSKIILFGGISAKSDFNKGYDLLLECLSLINIENLEIVVFGEKIPNQTYINDFKVTNIGYINGESELAMLYSAVDIVIVPSRQESFSQVSLESISCGTPVVAFNYSGPKDIIVHKENGYLATPYDAKDLANGIEWIFDNLNNSNKLNLRAREVALEKFDIKNVAKSHIKLYNNIMLN
jgi:glycosyltransferase involved in cell wall biosynthesis